MSRAGVAADGEEASEEAAEGEDSEPRIEASTSVACTRARIDDTIFEGGARGLHNAITTPIFRRSEWISKCPAKNGASKTTQAEVTVHDNQPAVTVAAAHSNSSTDKHREPTT